mmetsp:Transcript_110465/g.155019  ORF Transcript_110465/g.155019 Transcript_110465/m.155019 type:complete len:313 (+) Transcript_110465:242-1180(+)
MWLANLSAALDLEDSSQGPGDDDDRPPKVDPTTPDVTLVGEISKFGGSLLSEGGALLQEMNQHVFSGAMVDMLAPDEPVAQPKQHDSHRLADDHTTATPLGPKKPSVTKTVAVAGDESTHIAELARCLAQSGHNMAVAGPSKVATAAVATFNACTNRAGRSIGVMPEARSATYRRDRQFASEPEVPVFVQPRAVLRTLLCSCDVLVILGDDTRVVGELNRLRGATTAAVRLASTVKRTTGTSFLGSTVKSVDEVLEHVEQILSSNVCADLTRISDGGVVDDLVCVESSIKGDGTDDDLGTYEVVEFTEGGRR